MTEFFSCNDNTGRYIFNIVFFSLIGAFVFLLIFLAAYLLYKRYKKAKKRQRLLYRSRTSTANTTSTILSGTGIGSQLASNFILGRPPATDIVLGVYGDENSKNARTAFYEEKGWRGFAYWKEISVKKLWHTPRENQMSRFIWIYGFADKWQTNSKLSVEELIMAIEQWKRETFSRQGNSKCFSAKLNHSHNMSREILESKEEDLRLNVK